MRCARSAAKCMLHGDSYSDAYAHALEQQKQHGLTFVHPFDDPDVIAGQGTIAMEILRQHQGPLDAVFVAIGGGGLISGVANYIKAVRPEIKVIGVQMNDSDAMMQSVAAQRARDAGRRRPVLRRHRGQAGRRGNLPHRQRAGGRVHHGRHRRRVRRASRTCSSTRAASSSRPARWRWPRSSSTSRRTARAARPTRPSSAAPT